MEDFEYSFAIARKAMKSMFDCKCPASPRNFELFHLYASGRNKTLITEINEIAANTGVVSNSDAEKLWRRYCLQGYDTSSFDDIGSQLTGEIGQVLDMLNAAAGRNTEYTECLGSMSEQLVGDVDTGALHVVIESLVDATKEMTVQSRVLEDRLRDSKEQIAALKNDLDVVRSEALTDRLTGIGNRKHFDERLAAEIQTAENCGEDLCLLIGDIDFFKKFNDTYGHQTGDQVLCLVGQALKSGLKGRDLAARYGGEEFAIILPGTTLEAAVAVGNNIRNTVRAKELVRKSSGENLGNITMSFGAARYRRGEAPEQLIERADACLYAAKRGGRNIVKAENDPDVATRLTAAVA